MPNVEKLSRRGYLGGTAALLAGAAAASCGPFAPGGPGGPAGKAPDKIVWSTFRGGRDSGKWRQVQIERFQAKFSKTQVDLQALTQEYPKQFALAAAGTLGDVTAWDPSHWVFYNAIKSQLIRPIDAYVKRDKLDLNQWYKPFIDYQRWEGKLWGLPSWGWSGHDGLMINLGLAQQAGVTIPDYKSPQWTVNTIYDIAAKLNRVLERVGGFGLQTTITGAIGLTIWTRAFNSDNLSPNGKQSLLLEARNRDGLRLLYDLAHRERAVYGATQREGQASFEGGTLGMQQAGSLSVFNLTTNAQETGLQFKAMLFPKRQDGKRPSQLRGGTWNLGSESTGGKYPDYGWELIKLITDSEGGLTLFTIGGEGTMVRPDMFNPPRDARFQDPNFKAFLDNLEGAMVHIVPFNLRGQEYETAANQAIQPWYKGQLSHDDGLRQWNEALQKVLDQPPT